MSYSPTLPGISQWCGRFFWVTSISVTRKKDDSFQCLEPNIHRWPPGKDCCVPFFFPHVLELPNLTTQEETLQSLATRALFQGSIGYSSNYPWLKHVISIALLMSLRIWGSGLFRAITQQYYSVENQFERFRVVLELISRFEFEFRRLDFF